LLALVHDTPASPLSTAFGWLGLETIFQLVPFHCSTNVFSLVLLELLT
jgi:hypothetical protein